MSISRDCILKNEPEYEISCQLISVFQYHSLEIRFGEVNGERVCGTFPPICNIESDPF